MSKELYAKSGKIYASDYTEIYIPSEYFDGEKYAINKGLMIETLGLVYIRSYPKGKEGPIRLLNIPATIDFMIYDMQHDEINIENKSIHVVTLKYMKDAYVLNQTIPQGREIAESFLKYILDGKLPKTLNYVDLIDMWWKNIEISGVNFQVPSKIFEMIIANIYRNPDDTKLRFGQYYGKQLNPNGYDYETGNVRDVVEGLSTFSGMVFEDITRMITTGINNSRDNIEEPVSPLEKIIYY